MSLAAGASIEAQINGLIEKRLNFSAASPDTDLIASGLLDSLALVMLVTALEDEFDCELPLDDFDPEYFRTLTGIANFMRSSGLFVE